MEYKSVSCYDFLYSVEAEASEKKNDVTNRSSFKASQKAMKRSPLDNVKDAPAQANLLLKRVKMTLENNGIDRIKYARYLDRVNGGLFDRYGGEAQIRENIMIDDPVTILKGSAQEYIRDITNDVNKLYKSLMDMSKELESKTNAEQCVSVVQKYCTKYVDENIFGNKKEAVDWSQKLLKATKYKIARILTRYGEHKIYGFTEKSMVLKGYPKPNHIIVTLFENNPQEKPEEQSVSDVFKSADSFNIVSMKDQEDIFSISNMTDAALRKTVDGKVMNDIKLYREHALANFKNIKMPNKADEGKIIDQIWNGINASAKELLGRKSYIIRCINYYFEMIIRITKLARMAIDQMLYIENLHRDKKYDRHLNVSHQQINPNKKKQEHLDQRNDIINTTKEVNKLNK